MMLKEQVKALWKICFDDSEEFVEMYFRLRYKTEVNVAIQSGDEGNLCASDASLSDDFRRRNSADFLYFRSLYASRFPKQRGYERAFITVFRPDAAEWSIFQYIDTGRALVVRLLCPHGICFRIQVFN